MDREDMLEAIREFDCYGIGCDDCPLNVVPRISASFICPVAPKSEDILMRCTDEEIHLMYYMMRFHEQIKILDAQVESLCNTLNYMKEDR